MQSFRKTIVATLCLLSITLFFTDCFSQSALPATWQPGMVLTLTYGGGMRDYSSKTVISAEGSFIETEDEGKLTHTELHFTTAQLNELIKGLRANQFDKIHSDMRAGIVYDMGTSNTQLTWGNKVYGYSVGATTEIPDKYRKQYEAVSTLIHKLIG